ncbi:lycopene cyclase domain-containing protein [Chloroflexota bacterium]
MTTIIQDGTSFMYAYTVATLALVIIWGLVFFRSPQSRRAVLWTSLLLAPAGVISERWLIPDYWNPNYIVEIVVGKLHFGLEDFLFTFACAGIATSMFESSVQRHGFPQLPRVSKKRRILIWPFFGFWLIWFLVSVLDMKSMDAVLLGVILIASLMLGSRPELLRPVLPLVLVSGFLFWLFDLCFFVLLYPGAIEGMWNLQNTWGIKLVGIPLEEIVWGMETMLFAGPVFRASLSKQVPHPY